MFMFNSAFKDVKKVRVEDTDQVMYVKPLTQKIEGKYVGKILIGPLRGMSVVVQGARIRQHEYAK